MLSAQRPAGGTHFLLSHSSNSWTPNSTGRSCMFSARISLPFSQCLPRERPGSYLLLGRAERLIDNPACPVNNPGALGRSGSICSRVRLVWTGSCTWMRRSVSFVWHISAQVAGTWIIQILSGTRPYAVCKAMLGLYEGRESSGTVWGEWFQEG